MRRHRVIMVLAGAAAIWCAGPLAVLAAAAGGAVAQTGTWRTAIEVPGLGSLNGGGFAGVDSVSCGSAGNCGAGGFYTDRSAHLQAFVVNQKRGSWRRAIEVPGLGILNAGGSASVASVSCASAGKCAAGGSYRDGSGHQQAFVASEKHGTWGTAIEVPRSAALNTGGIAGVTSVSCASAGNCAAGGFYEDNSPHAQAFVVSEINGMWRMAIEVPGSAALNIGGAGVNSVSCASAGNCRAGGFYTDSSGQEQALVVNETNGTWGTAIEVPGSATLNAGGSASVTSVSCASAGNCAAGGSYHIDSSSSLQAFVASETNGTWGAAIEVPGSGALGGSASVASVSCASAGNCAAGGSYTGTFNHVQAFVDSQKNGTWGAAIEVPGSASLNIGGMAQVNSVSCASAGNCAAAGSYVDGLNHGQALVASETNGTWGTAIEVPGSGALNAGGAAAARWVSCPSAGNCAVGGSYRDGSGHFQAFVDSQA